MESCGMNMIKYLLFIFNLIFALSGLGIIIAGSVVLADIGDYHQFVTSDVIGPPIVLIVAGAIIFFIAFLGCFGAIKEKYYLLIAFAVCLLVIFILELAVGIAAAVYEQDMENALRESLKNSISNYTTNDSEKKAWDNIQTSLKCCGVTGQEDWYGQNLPYSCCHSDDKYNDELSKYCIDYAKGKYSYKEGCLEKFKRKIHSNVKVLIGVGIGIAFIEVVGIVLACWLAYTIKKEQSGTK